MAKEIKQLLEIEDEDTQKDKFLTFTIGSEAYGIEISFVKEIIGIQPVTQIPELPDFIKGIINLRGKIIPVMDVRLRFKKEEKEYNDRTCIIVVDINDVSVGLIVDTVAEVVNIPNENIALPPQLSTNYQNRYVKGIGKEGDKVKLLLDCGKLLKDSELSEIVEQV